MWRMVDYVQVQSILWSLSHLLLLLLLLLLLMNLLLDDLFNEVSNVLKSSWSKMTMIRRV